MTQVPQLGVAIGTKLALPKKDMTLADCKMLVLQQEKN